MNKDARVYNAAFPIWFLILLPPLWLFVLPVNFIIDSVILLIGLKLMKIEQIKQAYKKAILLVWAFGFLADIVGSALMMLSTVRFSDWWAEYIMNIVIFTPCENIYSIMLILASVLLAGACIYVLDLKIAFKKLDIGIVKKRLLALMFAVLTSPYIFFLPYPRQY